VTDARRGSGELAAIRRFDAHLADLRRAHAWLCSHGPLDELLRLTVPIAQLSYLRGRADLVLLLEETLRTAGALDPAQQVHGRAHPLLVRLLGYHATPGGSGGASSSRSARPGGHWRLPPSRETRRRRGTARRRWRTSSASAVTTTPRDSRASAPTSSPSPPPTPTSWRWS
jgi:hypothetical protein